MKNLVQAVLVAVALFVAPQALAANYTLWIHGRNTSQNTVTGNYGDFKYWGSASTSAGVNKKAVNWDGVSSISTTNAAIRNALDCYCTGTNWCYVAVHSAGNLQIGYALALYGGSTRYKKNAVPNSSGVCGNAGGTQTGWNIKWVRVASGAAGGSELADKAPLGGLEADLRTTNARALYNHNTTRGLTFYMYAGAKGGSYSASLLGQDDNAVSYHSTGGVSGASADVYCNPGDFSCNDLTLGTAVCQGGVAKWTGHNVAFRDDSEAYDHFTNGAWGGIVSVVRSAVVTYAK